MVAAAAAAVDCGSSSGCSGGSGGCGGGCGGGGGSSSGGGGRVEFDGLIIRKSGGQKMRKRAKS